MAKQRYINTKIWEDSWFGGLDQIEQLVFIYLLSNPTTNISGVYELGIKTICVHTGLEKRLVEEIFERFEKSGKAYYREGWVVLPNFIKHQNYKSPKIVAGIIAELENVPENIRILIKVPQDSYGIDTLSHLIKSNLIKSNLIDSEQSSPIEEPKKDKFEPVDLELATLLFDLIKQNTPTFKEPNLEKWAEHCRLMRERDERTPEQIRFLIKWSQSNDFWQANILSTAKLRQKFDQLVAQVKRSSKGKVPVGRGIA